MGFSSFKSLKSKFAASVAIVATIFAGLAGAVPAHATASIYTPTAGSNWAASTTWGNHYTLTPDTAGVLSGTMALPDSSIPQNSAITLNIPSSANSYFGDGVSHLYQATIQVRNSANVVQAFSINLGSFSTGTVRTYAYSTYMNGSQGWGDYYTIDPSANNIQLSLSAYAALNYMETMPAGSYSVSLSIKRDGVQIPGSRYSSTAGDNTVVYQSVAPGTTTVTLNGNQTQASAYVYTCLDSANIAVGDNLTMHPLLDGADLNSAYSFRWTYRVNGVTNYGYNQSFTANADLLANLDNVYAYLPVDSSGATGTHTVGLSIYDSTANREVSAACTVAAPGSAPTVTSNPLSTVDVALGVQGANNYYPYLTVQVLDSSSNVVASSVTSGSTSASLVNFSASYFTSGATYTVRFKKTNNFYNGGPSSAWSPTASFTYQAAAAPTVTQSNGQAIATATGLASNSYVAQAYLASSPNSAVAAASMTSGGVTGTYTATFSSGLTYGTPYVFAYCMGYTNYINGVATAVCNSGLSAQSSSISVVAPSYGYATPSVTGAGTIGAAQTGLSATTYNSGTFSRGSDGSNGSFIGQVGNGQITIKHLTPAGMDSSFGTNGTVTVPATGVMSLYSLGWTGNHDKWAMTWADSSMNVTAVVGNYSGTVLSSYTMATSSSAGATICNQSGGYSGVTNGNIYPPMVSNPMGDTYLMYSCQVPFTYSDSTSGSVMAYVLTKVTANNTATIVAKFNAVSNAENVVNGLTGSSTPTYSVNTGATGSAAAVVFALAYGAKTSATGMVSQFSRKLVVLKADGSVATVNGGAIPTVSGLSSETTLLSSVNNGSSLEGFVTTAGSTPSYSYRRIDVATAAVTDVAFTADAVTGFATSQYALPTNTVQSTATGNIWVVRTYTSGTTTKIVAAQLNLGTAAFTSYEVVTLAATSSNPTYNWALNSLDASGNVVSLFATSMTAYSSVYWRSTAASSGPSNVATATFTLNGSAVTDGGSYNVSNSATSATVAVTPTESHATYTVSGNSSLSVGNNTVTIVVTAQDGTTTHTYTFTVVRAAVVLTPYVLSFDKNNSSATGTTSSVSATSGWAAASNGYTLTNYSFTGWNTLANGNGTAYAAGASITLTADTVLYAQWLRDPYVLSFNKNDNAATGSMSNATSRTSWSIPGTVGFTNSGNFFSGWNTAANGSGTSYAAGASVTATADTTLYAQWTAIPGDGVLCAAGTFSATHGGYSSATNSWTCTDAPAGSFVSTIGALAATQCSAGYFAASAGSTSCTPASVGHFVAAAGATAEVACATNTHAYNTGAIACDPDRVLSSNKKATFVVAGKSATNGSIVELVGVPSSIGVLVSLADNRANATVSVPATPVLGNNLVTVFVYAEDGSVQESNITVHISAPVVTPPVVVPPTPKPSSDATAAIKANGSAIAEGGVINLPAGTTSVAVTVTPTESHATASVAGATVLVTGNNTVTVTVTAQDGSKKTYSFTAAVAAPLSADATATITVAGITVNDGDHVNLPFGTTQVAVAVTPTESHATYSVAGATGLATGTSVLTVTVTAQNGATKAYTYQLVVAADTTPVSVSGSSVSALDRVKAALAAGRAAMVTFSAKGAAAHASVVAQIRTFKAAARAAGISGRISFTITDASNSATSVVRVG